MSDDQKSNEFEKALDVKLDNILDKISRVVSEVEAHDRTLFGKDGNFGMTQKVQIMWRAHVWVLCSLSAGVGSAITFLISKRM